MKKFVIPLLLVSPVCWSCDFSTVVGIGISPDYNYTVTQFKDENWYRMGNPGNVFLGKLKAGFTCGRWGTHIEHISSVETTKDDGINTLFVEYKLF